MGYYVPSNFSANYVSNKKNEDGTRVYDSAVNRAGIDAQRDMQQLNKQYNMTVNNAYAQNLLANQGMRASVLGSGYKEAFAQNLQASTEADINKADLSVHGAKQSIFQSLGQRLGEIGAAHQQEVDYMRRTASGLEQYHKYVSGLNKTNEDGSMTAYTSDAGFDVGSEFSFEDNYDKMLDTDINNKGTLGQYRDDYDQPGLSYEDWLRQNSGTSAQDTAWLDWLYGGGLSQYKDFVSPVMEERKAQRKVEAAKAAKAAIEKLEAEKLAAEKARVDAAKATAKRAISTLPGSYS